MLRWSGKDTQGINGIESCARSSTIRVKRCIDPFHLAKSSTDQTIPCQARAQHDTQLRNPSAGGWIIITARAESRGVLGQTQEGYN